MKIYTNGKIIRENEVLTGLDIVCEGGKIAALVPEGSVKGEETVNLNGNYIAPGFIDIHCHGGGGAEFIDGTADSYRKACEIHSAHGTRVIFPTISATDYETMKSALEAAEAVKDSCACRIGGVHLEGPYLSLAMAGGQAGSFVKKPDKKEYTALFERFGSLISRWTYAPEEDENGEFLSFLTANGIIPSTGHSAAEYGTLINAFEAGNRLVTHLYSCTSTVTRHQGFRSLGIIETAFLLDGMDVEIIADGKHLPLELIKLILKIKGADSVCMITDSLRPAGDAEEGRVYSDTAVPFIIEDGVAKLCDRSAFAGSIATADVLLKTAVAAGCTIPEAVKMLTSTPARVMRLDKLGKIKPGYDELFTVFDEDLNIVTV